MPALVVPRTRVAVVAVPPPLPNPRIGRLARLPRLPAAPEDVLAVWAPRMLQPAVTIRLPLPRPPLRVARQAGVPLQRTQTQLRTRRVLGLQKPVNFGSS